MESLREILQSSVSLGLEVTGKGGGGSAGPGILEEKKKDAKSETGGRGKNGLE